MIVHCETYPNGGYTPLKKICTRALTVLLILLTVSVALPSLPVGSKADAGGRVPYRYSLDSINGQSAGGTMIGVIRDLHLPLGDTLEAAGWLATDEGVSRYEYLWLPSGGGTADWKEVTESSITPRPDLAAAGIPYVSGHGTAGFTFTVKPPENVPEGVYDVYIRGVDGMGVPCDLVALLGLRYGDPDSDSGEKRVISFPRLRREGEAATVGSPVIEDTAITLSGRQMVRLGDLNLSSFALMRIGYELDSPAPADGRRPILGLKSAGQHGYGDFGDRYNVTHSLCYAALPAGVSKGTLDIDLTACDYGGEVWLTGYLEGSLRITSVELIYNGYTTDRVAAKIHLSGDLISTYFVNYNRTTAKGITDPVLGDVLRLEVAEETNDPYAYFNAGALLKDHGILLDAHEYKYMVLLYRSDAGNPTDRMHLYLCSGTITGATEACNHGVTLKPDGKWHYLLVDLTQRENWGGIINGWRFDYLGESVPGQGVDLASVQFFRTYEAAKAAASKDPMKGEPFHSGDPAVIRDMSEEVGVDDPDYTIPPEDSFTVTEPETEPPTEPDTPPDTTPPADPADTAEPPATDSADTVPDIPADTPSPSAPSAEKKGCASALAPIASILLIALLPILLKPFHKHKGEHYEA